MEPVRVVTGTALPLDRSDVDTDQIIPAEYLKRVERTGFGPFLFAEWRKDPAFVLIATSFADIFRNNCTKIGLLPVELASDSVRSLMDAVLEDPSTEIVVDLERRVVRSAGVEEDFELDDYTRWRLMEGLDDIGLTLRREAEIAAHESGRPTWLPSTRS
jgi:3-isopropylmalate/(R)-2-methylmalate dehydratase small subunit